jgi:orotate phosphoribosyltransferase
MRKPPKKKYLQPNQGYGWTNLTPKIFTERMQLVVKKLAEIKAKTPFQAIAFCGSSGAAAAYIAGVALQVPVIYVRKPKETAHGSNLESNATKQIKSYVIVDDFICSGNTIDHIINKIRLYSENQDAKTPTCVGIVLYDCGGNRQEFEHKKQKIPLHHIGG